MIRSPTHDLLLHAETVYTSCDKFTMMETLYNVLGHYTYNFRMKRTAHAHLCEVEVYPRVFSLIVGLCEGDTLSTCPREDGAREPGSAGTKYFSLCVYIYTPWII